MQVIARNAPASPASWANAPVKNEHIVAWQTDNEYGCHDTTLSYSNAVLGGFRNWLARRYQSPQALNRTVPSVLTTDHGEPALVRHGRRNYLVGWPDTALLSTVIRTMLKRAGIPILNTGPNLRLRDRSKLRMVVNYGS